MKPLTLEQRRGLRMAAQVACALSLLAAGAGTSAAKAKEASGSADMPAADVATSDERSTVDRTADVLRLNGQGGGCFQPVTWGPLAPCEANDPLFSLFASEVT